MCKIQYYLHDCCDGLSLFRDKKFNYIYLGYATTRWKIRRDIIPLFFKDGLIFGYEIVSSLEQKVFHGVKLKQYGIMIPLNIHLKGIDSPFQTFKYIRLYDQCALCEKQLNKEDKQFINHYWGEGLCISCANEQLEQQGKEVDIAKINYRCNIIYYTGTRLENLNYPFGHKVGTIREYSYVCSSCNPKREFGLLYRCLICDFVHYCNACGLYLMRDNQMKYHSTCSSDHPLLRIVFPQKTPKGKSE